MNIEELINQLNFSNILWQIGTVLFFMLGDIISGIIQAIINDDLSSKIMKKGLYHKALILLIVLSSFILSKAFNIDLLFKAISIYIIIMEIISILENCSKAGLDVSWITKFFRKEEK